MPVYSVTNGGLGLQIILKALGVKGEVITTPFSYVATTSCPLWEGCDVKFADIEPSYLTINPRAVEATVGPDTEAIIGTHVFGNPCDCEALEKIAKKHGLALIFDAAHAFGIRYKNKSILEYGDASMISLHATKLMHTVEGGLVVARDPAVGKKIEWMRRFGHSGQEDFHGVGINAKMSELHAAMGLCNIKHIHNVLAERKKVSDGYDSFVGAKHGISTLKYREGASRNYSFYPVTFNSESDLLRAVARFNHDKIFPRRYFYPNLADSFSKQSVSCPVSNDFSKKILCLPLSSNMDERLVNRVLSALAE
jgi:dTDP-4-amino-4,6-dideoxygalactose transaminase